MRWDTDVGSQFHLLFIQKVFCLDSGDFFTPNSLIHKFMNLTLYTNVLEKEGAVSTLSPQTLEHKIVQNL